MTKIPQFIKQTRMHFS